MNTALWISAVALPIVAALHTYSLDYGYRGTTRREAARRAGRVAMAVAAVCFVAVFVATRREPRPVDYYRDAGGCLVTIDHDHNETKDCSK